MLWAACRHNKHFTLAFHWSTFCVNVHICASKACAYTRAVCASVWVCRMTVVWNLTLGASRIHERPLSCPLSIRCQAWIVLPESTASLWQIFTWPLKNIKQVFLWMGDKHWPRVAYMCCLVNQTTVAYDRKETVCHRRPKHSPSNKSENSKLGEPRLNRSHQPRCNESQ